MKSRKNENITMMSSSIHIGQFHDIGNIINGVGSDDIDLHGIICINNVCKTCIIHGHYCEELAFSYSELINLRFLKYAN